MILSKQSEVHKPFEGSLYSGAQGLCPNSLKIPRKVVQ